MKGALINPAEEPKSRRGQFKKSNLALFWQQLAISAQGRGEKHKNNIMEFYQDNFKQLTVQAILNN